VLGPPVSSALFVILKLKNINKLCNDLSFVTCVCVCDAAAVLLPAACCTRLNGKPLPPSTPSPPPPLSLKYATLQPSRAHAAAPCPPQQHTRRNSHLLRLPQYHGAKSSPSSSFTFCTAATHCKVGRVFDASSRAVLQAKTCANNRWGGGDLLLDIAPQQGLAG
jgi:hypothetical protein